MKKFYFIGDSHALGISGNDGQHFLPDGTVNPNRRYNWFDVRYGHPQTRWHKHKDYELYCWRVDAGLAHTLCDKAQTSLLPKLKNVSLDSNVCLSYGEIDCRAHIKKQAEKQNVSVNRIIESVVERYLLVYEEIKRLGYKNLFTMDISCGTDGGYEGTCFVPSCEAPSRGLEITGKFNKILKEQSMAKGFRHIETFEKITSTMHEKNYWYDTIHLLSESLVPIVLEELKRLGGYE
jgi:hypothetical protein